MSEDKQKQKNNLIKILFILASIAFAMPSIIYLLRKKTVFAYESYFQFLQGDFINREMQTLIYLCLLIVLSIFYFNIIKNRKEVFLDTKRMFLFIAIIALIFFMVLPFLSSDIFYYLGIGRLESSYHQNPYYTTIKEFVEQGDHSQYLQTDTVLATRI